MFAKVLKAGTSEGAIKAWASRGKKTLQTAGGQGGGQAKLDAPKAKVAPKKSPKKPAKPNPEHLRNPDTPEARAALQEWVRSHNARNAKARTMSAYKGEFASVLKSDMSGADLDNGGKKMPDQSTDYRKKKKKPPMAQMTPPAKDAAQKAEKAHALHMMGSMERSLGL